MIMIGIHFRTIYINNQQWWKQMQAHVPLSVSLLTTSSRLLITFYYIRRSIVIYIKTYYLVWKWQMFSMPANVKSLANHRRIKYAYCMNNQQLEEVTQEKDLCILISNDLKVSQQCESACSKATRILGIINRSIVFRHPDIMLRFYKSLVRPHLQYCTAAWSPRYCKDKELIQVKSSQVSFNERVQRRRSISHTNRDLQKPKPNYGH